MQYKIGDIILWYEDELNWGMGKIIDLHEEAGLYELENSVVADLYVLGLIDVDRLAYNFRQALPLIAAKSNTRPIFTWESTPGSILKGEK